MRLVAALGAISGEDEARYLIGEVLAAPIDVDVVGAPAGPAMRPACSARPELSINTPASLQSEAFIPSLPIQLRLKLSPASRGRHEPHRFLAQRGCVVRHFYSPVAQLVMTSWAASQVSSMRSLMRTSYAVFCLTKKNNYKKDIPN